MSSQRRPLIFLAAFLVAALRSINLVAAENESGLLTTGRSGGWRVEARTGTYWIISTKDPAAASQLPVESPEEAPVECHFSPNDEWLFTLPNGGSAFRGGALFRRVVAAGKIERIPSFNAKAWAQIAKLGALPKDCLATGAPAMMRF